MKLKWKRVEKDHWKSDTVASVSRVGVAKRRYEISRREKRTYGGTVIVEYHLSRFTVGKKRPRYFYGDYGDYPYEDLLPRTLKDAKALAQADNDAPDQDRRTFRWIKNPVSAVDGDQAPSKPSNFEGGGSKLTPAAILARAAGDMPK